MSNSKLTSIVVGFFFVINLLVFLIISPRLKMLGIRSTVEFVVSPLFEGITGFMLILWVIFIVAALVYRLLGRHTSAKYMAGFSIPVAIAYEAKAVSAIKALTYAAKYDNIPTLILLLDVTFIMAFVGYLIFRSN